MGQRVIWAATVMVGLWGCEGVGPSDPQAAHSFENVQPGGIPEDWVVAETNGRGTPAVWKVEADPDAAGGRNVMRVATRNKGQTYNLLMSRVAHYANIQIDVRIRADSGREDQGGGVIWRARDARNYYIARWNPLEDNVRVYKVVNGQRTMLATADVKAAAGEWHGFRARMRGDVIRVAFDGQVLLELSDETFESGGRVGLWTKADACTSFDELEVAWLTN